MVEPIERSTLAEKVAAAIKNMIVAQRLGPGDKLPSERELSGYFRVSRMIIREALRALSMAGMVRIEQGKGTFVQLFTGDGIVEQLMFGLTDKNSLLRQMFQLRIIIESGAVDLAVVNATRDDLARLRAIVEQMGQAAEQGHLTEELDLAFHQTLLESSKNAPLSRLSGILAEYFRLKALFFAPTLSYVTPAAQVAEHRTIVDSIERGDAETAKRLIATAIDKYTDALARIGQAETVAVP